MSKQNAAIESGGVEVSFGQNIQVLNNAFQTLNAPNDESDDGEAILAQHRACKILWTPEV